MSGYCRGTRNKYSTFQRRHTFVLLAQRLVLENQVITLRLHLLYLVMVPGEGSIQFGLQHGRVLPGLVEFFLWCLRPKHCVAKSLEHIRFLS
jgi:hypothetical protein